jgi:glycyl-tRNA synthetase beta chain
VPSAPLSVAVGLADKLDSLATFFVADILPTGSKDPFALRRAAIGSASLILDNGLRLELSNALVQSMARVLGKTMGVEERAAFDEAMQAMADAGFSIAPSLREGLKGARQVGLLAKGPAMLSEKIEPALGKLLDFFADRLKVQQREAGVRHDLIDAVFALGGEDDLVRLLARVKALQAFVETEEGTNLLAGYKRAANILKKEQWDPRAASGGEVDAEEQALIGALESAERSVVSAIGNEDFTAAMAAMASLRAPIDAFFDKVTVNAVDSGVRARRLSILARFRDAVHSVADFSKIEG